MKALQQKKHYIQNNFESSSALYDRYSHVQKKAASKLIESIDGRPASRILEIGCGTGNFTHLLRKKFGKATIEANDIAPGMIKEAKIKCAGDDIIFILSDANALITHGRYDLISSNVSLQWIEDIEALIEQIYSILKIDGTFAFSIFGSQTYRELQKSLQIMFGKEAKISAANFFDYEHLHKKLFSLFTDIEISEETIRIKHQTARELLRNIRHTGTRGTPSGIQKFWTPRMLNELEGIYRKVTQKPAGAIYSSYQLFICHAKKPS